MSNYNSGLFVGADGKVYDATNGMADTGLTADINRYAYNSGLFVNASGEVGSNPRQPLCCMVKEARTELYHSPPKQQH